MNPSQICDSKVPENMSSSKERKSSNSFFKQFFKKNSTLDNDEVEDKSSNLDEHVEVPSIETQARVPGGSDGDEPVIETPPSGTQSQEKSNPNHCDNTESALEQEVDVSELIPSLSTFDPSVIDLLPPGLKIKAKERVKKLKEQQSKSTQSMSSFFSLNIPSSSKIPEVEEEDLVECEQCKKKISAFTLPEHLDWHFAVSLAKETSNIVQSNTSKNVSQHPSTKFLQTGKRKRESMTGVSNSEENVKKICQKDISNYFRKK